MCEERYQEMLLASVMRRSRLRAGKPWFLLSALLALVACQTGTPAPESTPKPSALAVHCATGDQALQEPILGWAFCYPATWEALERQQSTTAPSGVDAVFDVTETAPGAVNGLFGVMIVSTDDRAGAAGLSDWVAAHVGAGIQLQPITWGNALEAGQDVTGHKRYALTPHQVVILELRSGPGNLDLESAMSARLDTWKFVY